MATAADNKMLDKIMTKKSETEVQKKVRLIEEKKKLQDDREKKKAGRKKLNIGRKKEDLKAKNSIKNWLGKGTKLGGETPIPNKNKKEEIMTNVHHLRKKFEKPEKKVERISKVKDLVKKYEKVVEPEKEKNADKKMKMEEMWKKNVSDVKNKKDCGGETLTMVQRRILKGKGNLVKPKDTLRKSEVEVQTTTRKYERIIEGRGTEIEVLRKKKSGHLASTVLGTGVIQRDKKILRIKPLKETKLLAVESRKSESAELIKGL